MQHVIIAIIISIISFLAQLFLCADVHVSGGQSQVKGEEARERWFDPKVFISGADWRVKDDKHQDWISLPRTQKGYQRTIAQLHEPILIANDKHLMKWDTWTNIKDNHNTARYLKDYKVTKDALLGNNAFLMTPFLRMWQEQNLEKWIPADSKVFDIGIGTGRSRHLWDRKNLQVWGVEPDEAKVATIRNKHINRIKAVEPWGGEDARIQTWIPKHEMDAVMMVYSLTFFFQNPEILQKLIDNIDHALKSGGRFILVSMDGAHVDKWFADKVEEIDNSFFHIKKLYKTRSPFGSEIEITIKSPFTLVEQQTEYLVDFDTLTEQLKRRKLTLEHSEYIKPPYYLGEWPAKFVASQRLMVFRKN